MTAEQNNPHWAVDNPMAILFIKSDLRLVIDLQTCVKAQQSRAYAQKVKISNLQQMARTIAYVQEHGYDSYEKLSETAEAIYGVQDFDLIPGIREHLSALDNDRTLGVRHDIAHLLGHLHQVGLDVKSGLTAAAAADHNDVFIPSILRMLWSTTHHQTFGLCEDDVVLEYRVDKRFDVLLVAP